MYISYQDFVKRSDKAAFIRELIDYHECSLETMIARDADLYEMQENITIKNFMRVYYNFLGEKRPDTRASNNKIASNFFHKLNTQRCNYLLGNGIKLEDEKNKEKLGKNFDSVFKRAAYYALIHRVSFIYWNVDHIHNFKLTEFVPLYDEETGELRAGVRYWQIDIEKPQMAVLYEEDGYTKFKADDSKSAFKVVTDKKSYRVSVQAEAQGMEPEVIGEENYNGRLPIIPIYAKYIKTSTLPGMRPDIDAYDIAMSGFANDMQDVAQIYWIIQNADGMSMTDLQKFFDRMKVNHIVQAGEDQTVQPYVQEVPFNARTTFLSTIRSKIYEDFGGLDVHTIAAGATNDHIDSAYQALDDETDEFEYCINEAMQRLLVIAGIDDEAHYKRNKISNETEYNNMILSASDVIGKRKTVEKLTFIEPDEVQECLDESAEEDVSRFSEIDDEVNDETD